VRARSPFLDTDRSLEADIGALAGFVAEGGFRQLAAVESGD
jgi:histidine ammonia-lyase